MVISCYTPLHCSTAPYHYKHFTSTSQVLFHDPADYHIPRIIIGIGAGGECHPFLQRTSNHGCVSQSAIPFHYVSGHIAIYYVFHPEGSILYHNQILFSIRCSGFRAFLCCIGTQSAQICICDFSLCFFLQNERDGKSSLICRLRFLKLLHPGDYAIAGSPLLNNCLNFINALAGQGAQEPVV